MTQTLIQEQINTIKSATKHAVSSKASAAQFLKDAGIIPHIKAKPSKVATASKKK